MGQRTPILCVDFDGVLHSYKSGWKGATTIPDPPIRGAIHWLRSLLTDADCMCSMAPRFKDFDVRIFSSRSRHWGGRRAMRKWLGQEFEKAGYYPELVELLGFPLWKPPSYLLIDDRAWCFRGEFPLACEMKDFRPYREA